MKNELECMILDWKSAETNVFDYKIIIWLVQEFELVSGLFHEEQGS